METYNSCEKSRTALFVVFATFLSLFFSVGINADKSDSDRRVHTKGKNCKRMISDDNSFVFLKGCKKADIDLITDKGSKIRIRSKGESNSVVINVGN